ncbi:MAG: DNA gyrase subunit A, partial [Actinomycetia bacterium]|nr:DNA gyrase subunit A [Actinomycetes bacterium]
DREGMRIVIELRKDANKEVVLNQLYKHTRMQTTFGVNMLALVDNQPIVLNLKQLIQHHIDHRKVIIIRRTEFDLKKAEARAHILKGLIIALDNIDAVIKVIKRSKDVPAAKVNLIKKFKLSEIQAQAILDMRLQKLTSLEKLKIVNELKELAKVIKELNLILKSAKKVLVIIQTELGEISKKYGDKRRTKIEGMQQVAFDEADLIANDEMVITITKNSFIKRISADSYKKQNRVGKGIIGSKSRTEDFVEQIFTGKMHDNLLLFSNKGKVFLVKIYDVVEGSRTTRGKTLKTLINLSSGEHITASVVLDEFSDDLFLLMATGNGIVKLIQSTHYKNTTKGGIVAISLGKTDNLISVKLVKSKEDLIMSTAFGYALRFSLKKLRPMGRTAKGVIGMRLRKGDSLVGLDIVGQKEFLLSVTSLGYGKRIKVKLFPRKSRGGKGMI